MPDDRDTDRLAQAVGAYEQELVNEARLAGHDLGDFGRRLSQFEVLASLQHHGAATRFLDFTLNAYVALWFASQVNIFAFGLVVAIVSDFATSRAPDSYPTTVPAETIGGSVADALQAYPARVLLWRPRVGYDRMLAQQSLLAFSTGTANPWGSFGFARSDDGPALLSAPEIASIGRDLLGIAIPPSLKGEVRYQGAALFGYSPANLFPDLSGFSQWHSAREELDPDMAERLSDALGRPRARGVAPP